MSENKFIQHLKGENTAGSLVEVKNQSTPASFGNMPQGTSEPQVKYADARGDVTVVANGTMNWKISNSNLVPASVVSGDGQDFTSTYSVSGAGLWVNATYTFPSTGDPNHPVAMIFNPNSKWVLKLCGDNLVVDNGSTVDLTLVITFGTTTIISKQFTVAEQANQFCKELVIDFSESNANMIKAQGLSTMKVQVLCGTANASARIYNGMTVFTVLQRKVDAAVVSNSFANVEEALRDGILPSDYFNNAAYIAQITDGETAYAVFQRDGDDVALAGWAQPIPDQANNAGKFLTTDGAEMSWAQLTISDVDNLSTELSDLQDQITDNKGAIEDHITDTSNPHNVTKAQVGLGNVDNTSDLNKPISTTTQTALDLKADKSTTYTKTETDTLLGAKQDIISDLSTIRSDAQAGKAASDTIATYGDIVTHNVAEFTTAAQVATAISTHNTSTTAHSNQFNAITEKIPAEASSSNKLADKAFVNSSIATNTANFIGTFNSVAELEAYSGTVTNNDYAFVIVTDSAGNTAYDRYKYTTATTPASWVFEYELNNSSFTATQWAAINSGANTTNIAQIATNTTTISNHIGNTSNPHQVTKAQVGLGNVDNTSDLAKPISTATQTALNAKANIADLATVATSGSYNDLSDKPTIPTVNNATLTIQKNGTTVQTFTANQGTNATANISVPTKTSDITNDSGFITSSALAPYALSADLATVATSGDYDDLSNKPTIPTVGNGTITITQGGISKGTFTTNQSGNTTIALDAGGGGGLPDQTGHAGEYLTTDGTDASWSDAIGYHPDLFDHKWADHILNDVSWLRADTFSWQSGAVYQAAYQHLADDIDGKTLQSEIIAGTTIQFYLADDGHKICPASQESNVTAIYNATGVAWYYIIDTINQQFKLPRTKFGFTGIRSGVGNYVEAGLPNITGSAEVYWESQNATVGAFYADTSRNNSERNNNTGNPNLGFDASRSSAIYGNSSTVQPPATQMYLYFYVGSFTQTALENTAGLNASLFNGKADTDLQNTPIATADYVVEWQNPTSGNNYTWYRKYKSGWVEQGGIITIAAQSANTGKTTSVTLPIIMSDTNYYVAPLTFITDGGNTTGLRNQANTRTTTQLKIQTWSTTTISGSYTAAWQVSGMVAN